MSVRVRSPYSHESAAAGPPGVALTRENVRIAQILKLEETTRLTKDVAELVAAYAVDKIDRFGAAEWMRYYGADVGLEPELSEEFYAWWLRSDVIEPDKLNCETHLPPVLRPRWITKTDAAGKNTLSCYNLGTLGRLARYPKEGSPSRYYFDSEALQQHGNSKAGPARWIVMRKDVLARHQSCDQQQEYMQKLNANGAEYDKLPSALDLVTIVFAIHVRSEDRHLGDETGKEGRWTFSRCKERTQSQYGSFPLVVGGFVSGIIEAFPTSLNSGLNVDHENNDFDLVGVAALRKF